MPHKKKRFFTKTNSTKYVLVTDGRDENGEKIKQNVLVPVPNNHKPEAALLFSQLAGVCGLPNDIVEEEEIEEKEKSNSKRVKKFSESASDQELDLDKILDQMEDCSEDEEETDSEDEEFEAVKSRMQQLNFFDEPNRPKNVRSNIHVEILEDESEFSDDFGQFSDAESDSDSYDVESQTMKKGTPMTSAKSDCPENLKILNEGFEKILEEYTDTQIGGLDDEEICGTFSTENEQMQNFIHTPLVKEEEDVVIGGKCEESLKKKILLLTEIDEPEHFIHIKTEKPLEYDCESIISTYSNQYNHPVIIKEESKIRKIKIPHNPLKSGLTKSQLKTLEESESESEEEDDNVSVATSCNIRAKGETLEQKRERKALFKEAKRESRKLKKENKLAFMHEKKIQTMCAINVRNNMGIKLM